MQDGDTMEQCMEEDGDTMEQCMEEAVVHPTEATLWWNLFYFSFEASAESFSD